MDSRYQGYEEDDDGRVVADMSDVEMTPLLIPRFENILKNRRDIGAEPEERNPQTKQPVYLDSDERKAMIGGAVSAALLVGGIIAAAFAGLILLILHVYG